MPLFGKKKEESQVVPQVKPVDKMEPEGKPSEAVELLKMNLQKSTVEQKQEIPMPPMAMRVQELGEKVEPVQIKKQESGPFAPIFIKLDRYKNILHDMAELKMTVLTIKNTVSLINEMDKMKTDSMKMIQDAIARVDKKLANLDSEFLKPSGYRDALPQEMGREDIQTELDQLRGQIEALRFEMEQTA